MCPLNVLMQLELDHNTFCAWTVTPVCFLKGSMQLAVGLNPVREVAASFPLSYRTERTSGVTQTLLEGNQSHTWRRPVAKQLQATPQESEGIPAVKKFEVLRPILQHSCEGIHFPRQTRTTPGALCLIYTFLNSREGSQERI